jgi:hypothetical protein
MVFKRPFFPVRNLPVSRRVTVYSLICSWFLTTSAHAQLAWERADHLFPELPAGIEVYRTNAPLQGRPNIAWYVSVSLKEPSLEFITDTTKGRRLTPRDFHARNDQPAVVINGTFFSFPDSRNLNLVMNRGKQLAYNVHSIPARGRDTGSYFQVSRAALGIRKDRSADAAWILTDTGRRYPLAFESSPYLDTTLVALPSMKDMLRAWKQTIDESAHRVYRRKWKMETAIGGGPMLVQEGRRQVTNDAERMFAGKAINDLHPRTAIGYTRDGRLIILAVQGRFTGEAEGASLNDLADILVELGAWEALNLDGGGSSCLLVQGKETIRPSDKNGQRPVPAVFMIRKKR